MSALAASLLVVLAVAKVAILWGRELPHSAWAPLAFAWQDVAVVLGFALFERAVRREWAARTLYGALVLLAAVNVPVVHVLSSPLTMPMLRAARGAMADSIAHEATVANVGLLALVLAVGIVSPFAFRRVRAARDRAPGDRAPGDRTTVFVFATLALVAAAGAFGARRLDTAGLERHPLVAIAQTSLPRVRARAGNADWRASPVGAEGDAGALMAAREGDAEHLSALRGAAAGRNVLLVVLEGAAARYLAPWGATENPMPNLSALAARSLVFESAYAAYPESVKGFVALIASRYPAFDVPAERHAAVVAPSLATALAAAGYETALFHSGRFMYLGMEELLARSGFARLEDAGAIGGNRESSFGVDEASAVRRMLEWIDSRRSTSSPSAPRLAARSPRLAAPFFIMYLPIAGHHPYFSQTPGPFPDSTELGRYRNALHDGDAALGDLLAGLRTRGLDRSTLVVVTSDHGEAFGQHAGNFGHTLALYDENVRVPLVFAAPGALDDARRVRHVASLLDVAPTVLDLLALAAPREFEGESLLGGRARMALFFTDYSLGLLGLRDGCTKYIHELESGRSRMFDVCADPEERVDVTARNAERAAMYRERLRAWSGAVVAGVR